MYTPWLGIGPAERTADAIVLASLHQSREVKYEPPMAAVPLDRLEDLPGLKSEAPMKSEEPPLRGYINRAAILGGCGDSRASSWCGPF